MTDGPSDLYARIYRVVKRIPSGRVATYGQVAQLAGLGGHARQVGYALHASDPSLAVPWQRVINRMGGISSRGRAEGAMLQRELLEDEGVAFDDEERCDLEKYRWEPRDPDKYFFGPSKDAPF